MITFVQANYNYLVVVLIIMLGLWAMISKNNLVKKAIGMAIFQTGIILFYISMGAKKGSTIPILKYTKGAKKYVVDASTYANPLTHILMLTAIVVGVATLGLALTLIQNIYKDFGSLEEDEVLEKIAND
jgi:multicomponent Na+:H+ antiporter subunit C